MTEKETILDALNRVLASKEFQASKTRQRLLAFLVDASLGNREVKEYTIASEVFDKKDFDPATDASVRVYLSSLRKKLEDYYREEGAEDRIQIQMPKGHYDIVFVDKEKNLTVGKRPLHARIRYLLWGACSLVVVLAGLLAFVLVRGPAHTYADDFLWREFNASPLPKTLILGNDFFFLQGDEADETIVRKHSVNSLADFERFKSQTRIGNVKEPTPYSFFPLSTVSPLPAVFQKANLHECTLLPSSRVVFNDLLANDILFLGSFRNLYLLERLFQDRYLAFNLVQNNNSLTIASGDSAITLKLLGIPDSAHSDYCLFRKIPGPGNNTIILIMSFFDTGMRATMHFMNDPDEMHGLEEKFVHQFGYVPRYFDIVFRVSGFSRTAYKITPAHLHEIDPAKLDIWE